METKTRTGQILTVMKILAWVAMIGYAIESGAVLISFAVSFFNHEAAKDLYQGLNLYALRQFSFSQYIYAVSFIVATSIMKSYIWSLVIHILSKINLVNPFKMEVAQTLEKISYVLFVTWLIGMLSSGHATWLLKKISVPGLAIGVSGEFIFMAGLVFIISQVFKRGVEIQSENELTV